MLPLNKPAYQTNSQQKGWIYKDGLNPVVEIGSDGEIVSEFVYGKQGHVPELMIKDGIKYRIVTDHRGSVRLVVNVQTGDIAQRIDYTTWGKVVSDTNPGFQPFGFAGGLYDEHTGLVRFGARDYDPSVGRWTAKDPIRWGGGQLNLYVYVGNDPVNFIDPSGEQEVGICEESQNDLNDLYSKMRCINVGGEKICFDIEIKKTPKKKDPEEMIKVPDNKDKDKDKDLKKKLKEELKERDVFIILKWDF